MLCVFVLAQGVSSIAAASTWEPAGLQTEGSNASTPGTRRRLLLNADNVEHLVPARSDSPAPQANPARDRSAAPASQSPLNVSGTAAPEPHASTAVTGSAGQESHLAPTTVSSDGKQPSPAAVTHLAPPKPQAPQANSAAAAQESRVPRIVNEPPAPEPQTPTAPSDTDAADPPVVTGVDAADPVVTVAAVPDRATPPPLTTTVMPSPRGLHAIAHAPERESPVANVTSQGSLPWAHPAVTEAPKPGHLKPLPLRSPLLADPEAFSDMDAKTPRLGSPMQEALPVNIRKSFAC